MEASMKAHFLIFALFLANQALASDQIALKNLSGESASAKSSVTGKDGFSEFCVKKFDKANCLQSANNSSPRIQYMVGILFEKGFVDASRDSNGTITKLGEPNYTEARKWFAVAASNGDENSAVRLAELDKLGWASASN